MIEQFNFDIRLIFAILNGKVSAAINRKLSRNFRQNGLEITPEQWTVLIFLWEKDGVTQQELCNATFKDKPSMTRLIDNMERQHLVVRISDKKDRRTNLIHLTKEGKESGVGVENVSNEKQTKVYPRLIANGEVLTVESPANSTIRLMTMQGSVIMQQETTNSFTRLPINGLSQGIYLLTVVNASNQQTFKVIVK